MVSEAAHCFSISLVLIMLPINRDLFGLPLPAAKINCPTESIDHQYTATQGRSYTYHCTVPQTGRPQWNYIYSTDMTLLLVPASDLKGIVAHLILKSADGAGIISNTALIMLKTGISAIQTMR